MIIKKSNSHKPLSLCLKSISLLSIHLLSIRLSSIRLLSIRLLSIRLLSIRLLSIRLLSIHLSSLHLSSIRLSSNSPSSLRLLSICLFLMQYTFAQKKDDNIGTEVVNVVKPYSPTVSDANKIKEVPAIEDEETLKKQEIKYKIFSFPVASTFTPSKGKAAGVEKAKQERLYSNYVTLGFGNFATANAELFVTHELDRHQYLGAMFRHQSSQGKIAGVELDNKFYDTSLDALYGYHRNDTKFFTNLGYKNEVYNWFGIPIENKLFNKAIIKNIEPIHAYNTANVDAQLSVDKSFFNQLNLNYIGFWDDFNSNENRFIINPSFNFDLGDASIKANFGVDYLNASFDTSYIKRDLTASNNNGIQKSIFISNLNPSVKILKNDLSFELGADFVYFSRIKDINAGIESNPETKIYIYPKIDVSYKVVGDLMIAFAGAEGKLIQNSYANFASQNKFLSPTLLLEPTDQQYDAYLGLRGKLASMLSYNLKGSYNSSKDKALFKSNPYTEDPLAKVYKFNVGNSYSVVYDNIKTASFFSELKADVNKDIALGFNVEFNSYSSDIEAEAWNLPTIKASFTSDFNVGKKWYAGTQLFYVGDRKDEFTAVGFPPIVNPIQTLDAFFDINANVGYKHNDRLTIFLKGNNLANQNYNRWLNYPVQGVQVLLGASYKFDF
jgi:outer membrane receptor protein involved in Fe transport